MLNVIKGKEIKFNEIQLNGMEGKGMEWISNSYVNAYNNI